jgi:hypothetical protein
MSKRKILVSYCPKCGREITNYKYVQISSSPGILGIIKLCCGTCMWSGSTEPLDWVRPKWMKKVNLLGV